MLLPNMVLAWKRLLVQGQEHDVGIAEIINDDGFDPGLRHRHSINTRAYLIPHLLDQIGRLGDRFV